MSLQQPSVFPMSIQIHLHLYKIIWLAQKDLLEPASFIIASLFLFLLSVKFYAAVLSVRASMFLDRLGQTVLKNR